MKQSIYRSILAAALCVAVLALSVGVTYARVTQEETAQLAFTQSNNQCYLTMGSMAFSGDLSALGEVALESEDGTEDATEDTTEDATEDATDVVLLEKYIPFTVSNTDPTLESILSDQLADTDISFTLQAYVSASEAENPLALRIAVINPAYDEENPEENPDDVPQYLTYQGVAQEIVEGTQTYETFGAGYLYQFYYTETVVNAKGAEVAVTHLLDATLTAGEVSVFYGTLYITGETDARQIQLNVVRTYDT